MGQDVQEPAVEHRAGIQSIEVGAPLLVALCAAPAPMTLTALATAVGMSSSKAHKYLASFVRVGLVSQNGSAGRYAIGPLATELGFAALRRLQVVEMSQDALDTLRDEVGMTASLAIWGNHGPTVVRKAETRDPVSLVVQLGTVLPLLTSSNGLIHAAFLDRMVTRDLLQAELTATPRAVGPRSMAAVERLLQQIREQNMASVTGLVHAGTTALSVPVWDHQGRLAASMTLVNVTGLLDTDARALTARALRRAAADLSVLLGAQRSRMRT